MGIHWDEIKEEPYIFILVGTIYRQHKFNRLLSNNHFRFSFRFFYAWIKYWIICCLIPFLPVKMLFFTDARKFSNWANFFGCHDNLSCFTTTISSLTTAFSFSTESCSYNLADAFTLMIDRLVVKLQFFIWFRCGLLHPLHSPDEKSTLLNNHPVVSFCCFFVLK